MPAYGAEPIEFEDDCDEAHEEAARPAELESLQLAPPFHRELVKGVSIYVLESFSQVPDLDTVLVPIRCGSGICIIIGVVAENARCMKLSFEAKQPIETNSANTFADGVAVRIPAREALEIYQKGAEGIVSVSEDEIAEAIRIFSQDNHNLAEGAGALPLAAMLKERDKLSNRNVAIILSGANLDIGVFREILSGGTWNNC